MYRLIQLINKVLRLDNPDVVVHHSGGFGGLEVDDKLHKDRWNWRSFYGFYLGYHYYIERDGRIYTTRKGRGAHTYGHNEKIGICLVGNGEIADFTKEQYGSLEKLLKEINPKHIYGHRDLGNTVCPSERLYNWILTFTKK